ncbi:putative bifunctional diguanylate cyclase/phosphodiesterase [Rhodospirillum centenum]|uniref:Sensory box-containing diguanylate cyclase, putative n=1 Tax=Rhodospirillum centenum (strain ATCC 51521 / SW) TaxID=414684 RepID=B6ISE7_RHOCS|nr:EAL domain-containing protein [Rhodospirillum centenum]ACI98383.1 sensory box-containing diguanylate cyclase, putative [Rhodospirillum centenum SW]
MRSSSRALGHLARSGPFLKRDLPGCLRAVTETAAAVLAVGRVSVWFFSDDARSLRAGDIFETASGRHAAGPLLAIGCNEGYRAALETERPLRVDDVGRSAVMADLRDSLLIPEGNSARLDAPVIHQGSLVGVVCCEHAGGPRSWTDEEAAFAASLADFVALALAADEARRAEERAREADRRWRDLFENAVEGVFRMDLAGRLRAVNPALVDILGYGTADALMAAVPDGRALVAVPADRAELRSRLRGAGIVRGFETMVQRADGDLIWVSLNLRRHLGAGGETSGYEGTLEDISHRRRMEQEAAHVALHDGLTGLPNRTLLVDRLAQALRRRRAGQSPGFGVFLIDCDNFRMVNNTLGHALGDRMLAEIARRLSRLLGAGDTLARLGSDDFAVLCEQSWTPDLALRRAEEMRLAVMAPMEVPGHHDLFPSVSVAVVLDHGERETPDEVLRDLGIAVHYAKARGRARCISFEPAMRTAPLQALRLQTELRRALERDEIGLALQPVVDLPGRRLIGFEALARWAHPGRGSVSPTEFIPIAEESGLIVALGETVLRKACALLRSWQPRLNGTPLTVSVNVSPVQLARPDLFELVDGVIAATGVDVRRLKLEVTETALAQDLDIVSSRLDGLRQRGFRILIDDFGTGYSSLSRLHRLPFDGLKVDQSFVRPMLHDEDCRNIVRTVVALGHALGVDIVAEGVEDPETGRELARMGCTSAQGYHFGRPLSPADADRLVGRLSGGPLFLP